MKKHSQMNLKQQQNHKSIPFRYILTIMITVIETLMVLAVMFVLQKYVPYFSVAIIITQISVALSIINSKDNPDYKIPWLVLVIENAALRGVDVRIVTPHIPDKKLIFSMTCGSYKRLIESGVKIYEYESEFIHAKMKDNSIQKSEEYF